MDRKDDMDLESLKNMLSDVPDTDEFDLDSIIAEVSGQAPAKAAAAATGRHSYWLCEKICRENAQHYYYTKSTPRGKE